MNLAPILLLHLILAVYANCEKLSTVFVLETADSSSANNEDSSSASQKAPEVSNKLVEDPNTRIITDGGSTTRKPQQQQQQQQSQVNATVRRNNEESQTSAQRVATRNVNAQPTINNQPKQRTSTTTSAPYTTTPKTEERLLISITSNDDDDYKPPSKQVSSDSTNQGDELQPTPTHHQQQQQGSPNKRKPSITISIHDPNLKQNSNSGSGSPAVILRPSENGQSIIISTVESGSSGNKYVGQAANKPAISIGPAVNEPIHNNNQNSQHQTHYTSTSTYRPPLVNDYNPANRPVVSTLVDPPQRPSQAVTEERPQRPIVVQPSEDTIYDSLQQRPTPRPVAKPVQVDTPDYNNNEQNNDYGSTARPNSNQEQTPKYPLNEKNCGLLHETRIVGGEEANPDDYLYMAALVKSKPKDDIVKPFCGGSLITRRHILTAAHCLENLAPRDILVRLGSYDFDDSTASSASADFAIDQFRVPSQYSKKTHVADIAIIRLKTPLTASDNYKTICMPQARRSYVGALGTVIGYGSQSQTFRRAAPKLRQVTVPIISNAKCSQTYKKNLTESFLCAGYEEGGRDACQGDSGGPLSLDNDGRSMVVGVVSHGIGCGSPGYPGVYTRVSTYLDWLEKNTKE